MQADGWILCRVFFVTRLPGDPRIQGISEEAAGSHCGSGISGQVPGNPCKQGISGVGYGSPLSTRVSEGAPGNALFTRAPAMSVGEASSNARVRHAIALVATGEAHSGKALAKTRRMTAAAPQCLSVRAHSLSEAPVVITSSTRRMVLLARGVSQRNAPRILFLRSRHGNPACAGVLRTRRHSVGSNGRRSRAASGRASSSDWLNPRSRSRAGCKGSGAIRSALKIPAMFVCPSAPANAASRWPK